MLGAGLSVSMDMSIFIAHIRLHILQYICLVNIDTFICYSRKLGETERNIGFHQRDLNFTLYICVWMGCWICSPNLTPQTIFFYKLREIYCCIAQFEINVVF